MKKYLSRNEAAELCSVDPQTITNWAESGYFKVFRPNKITYRVERSSFLEFIESNMKMAKDIEEIKKELQDKKVAMEKEVQEIDEKMKLYSECNAIRYYMLKDPQFLEGIEALLDVVCDEDWRRESSIIRDILVSGKSVTKICKLGWYGLTRERIRQIYIKGLKKFGEKAQIIRDVMEDNRKMHLKCMHQEKEIKDLKKEVYSLSKKVVYLSKSEDREEEQKIAKERAIVRKKLMPYQKLKEIHVEDVFSNTRVITCLKYGEIKTLFDLLQYPEHELLKFRHFGEKSLNYVKETLEEFNTDELGYDSLTLGMISWETLCE